MRTQVRWGIALAICAGGASDATAQAGGGRAAFLAESTAIARNAFQLALLEQAERAAARQQAVLLLTTRLTLTRGTAALDAPSRAQLDQKAWYLYLNPALRLQVAASADSGLGDDDARDQVRARSDSVRAYLVSRGVELSRIDIDEGGGSTPGGVEFTVTGDLEVTEVPPSEATPPAPERTGPFLSAERRRYPWGVVRIFYATDRQREAQPTTDAFYSGERASSGQLEFGRIEVTVPRVHRPGHVEQPVWYRLERLDASRHLTVRQLQPLTQTATMDSLRRVVAASGQREALVFIHGYNVPFRDAALRTAQLTYDLAFDGAPILYSWPSRGSLFHYSADREAAEWSAAHLRSFLDSVSAATGAARVNVIAHSMGNRALTLALEGMQRTAGDTPFANVVLAAADVDVARFRDQLAARILPLTRRLTIYQSSGDKALSMSRLLATNPRLGESTDPMVITRGADTIDASSLKTDLLGHGYIASNKSLIDDLVRLLRDKLALPRSGLERVDTQMGTFWRFP